MVFEETDQVIAGDAPVLASWNTVTAKASGIEPFGNGAGSNLADAGNLARGENILFHESRTPWGGGRLGNPILVLWG
jgi:hypothetical protein